MNDTFDTPINKSVESGLNEKSVKTYLKLIADNNSEKNKQVAKNNAIQELFESTFDITDPSGTVKINSMRLYQALWRTANRLKPLDFMVHGSGRPMFVEQVITKAIATVMDRGGYDSALRDKNGTFFNMLMYGDGFIQVGANPNKKSYAPILFTPVSVNNIYIDNFATGIRNRGKAGSAYRAVVVFSYSWTQACEMWPELKERGGIGKIPRNENAWKMRERSSEQTFSMEDEVEIAFGYDTIRKNFTVFAGQACTVLEQFDGDEYPYVKDSEPYIPILQFICIPSSEGPYNFGIGSLLYKLAVVTSNLLNLEYSHVEDSTYPLTLVNVAQSEAATFFGKLSEATRMRNAGKKPFVAMTYDPNAPNSNQVNAHTLTTQNLINEWQLAYNTLIDEVQMLGINLKELTMEGNPTATEILSDEENSNSFVKQMMEYNASETQEAVEITMDGITQYVSKKSKIPINFSTQVEVEGENIKPEDIVMGLVSQELKDRNYFVVVNSRTGAIPSNTMLRAKMMQMMPFAAPGSKAQQKIIKLLGQVNDIDIPAEEYMPAMGQQIPTEGGEMPQQATETDRLTFNPRTKEQLPIF